MKKILILILYLIILPTICSADHTDMFKNFSIVQFITTLTSASTGQKESNKTNIKLQQYQDALEKKLRKGFDGPDVTNVRKCYITRQIYHGINIITLDGHDYILYTDSYQAAMVHSESCPCKRMEEIK